MGKRLHTRNIHFALDINAFRLFGENDRNLKISRRDTGNSDAGSFNRQYFINPFSGKPPLKFLSHPFEQPDIHLMIQKTVHFQHIAFFDDSVLLNPFF